MNEHLSQASPDLDEWSHVGVDAPVQQDATAEQATEIGSVEKTEGGNGQGELPVDELANDLFPDETAVGLDDEATSEPQPQLSWWKHLRDWFRPEGTIRGDEKEAPVPPSGEAPESSAPELTLEDVETLIREELAQVRADVPALVQDELVRNQAEVDRVQRLALQGVADQVSATGVESLRAELALLDEAELPTLQQSDLPLRERLEQVDWVRGRRAQIEGALAARAAALEEQIAGGDLLLARLAGQRAWLDLQNEIEQQKEAVSELQAHVQRPERRLWRLALALLAVLLILAVGVAGILLPRRTADSPSLLIDLAALYQATGDREAASARLNEALKHNIRDVGSLTRIGQIYRDLEEYAKAASVLEKAVSEQPQNRQIRLSLAQSYGQAGQHALAIDQYERLLEADSNNWQYHLALGEQYEAEQNYEQAFTHYGQVAEVAPERYDGYVAQADIYRDLERYDEAIESYQRALEVDPNVWWVRILLGQSYEAQEMWDRAIEQFQAAIELNPNVPAPFLEMGRVARAQGDYEEALTWLEAALEVQPNHVATVLEMGQIYVDMGECGEAVTRFLRVLELQPNNADAQAGLRECQAD